MGTQNLEKIQEIQSYLKKSSLSNAERRDVDSFFQEMYHEHNPSMVKIIAPILYFRNEVMADTLQEGWLDVFRFFVSYNPEKNLSIWLNTIFYRKAKKASVKLARGSREETTPLKSMEEISVTDGHEDDNKMMVTQALSSLSSKEYFIVFSFFYERKKIKDICLELGISRGTFYHRLNIIKRKIRKHLDRK